MTDANTDNRDRDGASTTLVFGDDGSPGSDAAWAWVCAHRWPGWHADVVTATPPKVPAVTEPDAVSLHEWESPHPRTAGDTGLDPVRSLTSSLDPRLLFGAIHDAGLIVVAPHVRGTHHEVAVGSTAEWLLHHPPAPLAIVREPARVEHAILAVDGSPDALRAVGAFAHLPLAREAQVVVFAVDDGRSDAAAVAAAALDVLESAGLGVGARVETATGKPTKTILDRVAQSSPQLVVLGTRGLTGWKRLRLGSTASAVVRAARCSTLVACHE